MDFRAGATRYEFPMVVAPIHALDPSGPGPDFDDTLLQGRIQGSWTLFDGGVRGGRIGAADASARAAAAAVDDGLARLLEEGVGRFLSVLTSRVEAEANRERVEALEAEEDRARRFVDEGAAPRVELLRASAALQQARADSASAGARLRVAERELARYAGLDPELVEGRPLQSLVPPDGATGNDSMTGTSVGGPPPALRRAQEVVSAAAATVDGARGLHLPRLAAAGGMNQFGGAATRTTTEWDVGVQLHWSLFSGGSRKAGVDRARAELRRAREELRLAELQQASGEDLAAAALTEALARREALVAAVEGFEEVTRIEELAMTEGAGVQRDFLAARASLLEARAGLARAEEGVVMAHVFMARIRGELTLSWVLDRWVPYDPRDPGAGGEAPGSQDIEEVGR